MKDTWIKKGLVVSVIFLFVGVAVAPSINQSVVKASHDNDLVEVTTQACGIKGYGNTTVKLTRQQYQNLELYLVEFRARLNQTTTREEAVPIFKEAVVELNKYGLLPKGMSVERAQKLVTGKYQNFQDKEFIKKFYNNYKRMLDENVNIFCLFAGKTDNTWVHSFLFRLFFIPLIITDLVIECFSNFSILYAFLSGFFWLLVLMLSVSPIGFNEWIEYGYVTLPFGIIVPANGWVYTNGLNGVKNWTGSFSGAIISNLLLHLGTLDFTGISLYLPLKQERFCLGAALIVKLA
jgi:hypothetical protein